MVSNHETLTEKNHKIIKRIPNSLKLIIPSKCNNHILMSTKRRLVNYRGDIYEYNFKEPRGEYDMKFQIELKSNFSLLEQYSY